jgi:uncharacterized protein YkwD
MLKHTFIALAASALLIATPSVLNLHADNQESNKEFEVLYEVHSTETTIEVAPKATEEVVLNLEVETEVEEVEVEIEETEVEEVKQEPVTPTQPKTEVKPQEPTPTQPKSEPAPTQPKQEPAPTQPKQEPTPAPTQPKEEPVVVETIKTVELVSTTPAATWELEILRLTNIERQKVGLPILTYISSLDEGAKIRSIEIITKFSHTRPDGTRFFTVFGPDFTYRNIGENLASGFRSPEQVVAAWMNSQSHRANILNEKFEQLSVAITKGDDGKYRWVQIFYRGR